MPLKAITLRIDQNLYEKTKNIVLKEKRSLNSFIEYLIIEKLKERENKELFDEFSVVGTDQEVSDVEYSLSAQKEVVFNEKP